MASRVSQLLKLSQCIPLGMTQRQRSEDGLCSFRVQ